jgi:branched-chain amino acid transport system substrate-binding protein
VRLPRVVTASLAASALLLAGLTGCSSDEPGAASEVVIGIDYNDASPVDVAYYRAAQLRVDQVNASGRLGKRRLRLHGQVSRSDSTTTLRDLNQFADDSAVAAVIVGSCDQCLIDANKTIEDRGLPTIALSSADAVAVPLADRQFVFKLGPDAGDTSAALLAEIRREKTTVVSVLSSDDTAGKDAQQSLVDTMTQAGLHPSAQRTVKPTATDLSEQMAALTGSQVQALVVLTDPDLALLAAKSARATGWNGHIYFGASAAGNLFIPADASRALNGTKMAFTQTLAIDDVIATTPAKAARKQWFRDYTSRYGSYSGVAAFAGDAVDLIAAAVARAGTNRARIRDILETSQIDGLAGSLRLTPDNHSALMPQAMTLLVARAGRWRLAS